MSIYGTLVIRHSVNYFGASDTRTMRSRTFTVARIEHVTGEEAAQYADKHRQACTSQCNSDQYYHYEFQAYPVSV